MFGTTKSWVVRVGAGLPFSTELHCVLLLVSILALAPVGCQCCQGGMGDERPVQHLNLGSCLYLCLPGIAALTPVKPFRHLISC